MNDEQQIEIYENVILNILDDYALNCYKLDKYEEGIKACKKILALDAKIPNAWHNLAFGLANLQQHRLAIDCYQKAIKLKPWFIHQSIWAQAHSLLMLGNTKRGFKLYEARLKIHTPIPLVRTNRETQLWQGESIVGKTLLLHHDGGFGDSIHFLRYIPYLKSYNCKILLFLQPELNCLFEHLNVPLIKDSKTFYDFDRHVFMCSLPYCFNTQLSDIPAPVSIKCRLKPVEKRIGITWRGGPGPSGKNFREMDLQQLIPLLKIPGYQFVCVQKEVTDEETKILDAYHVSHPPIHSFLDTVKILEECEQVITIDGCAAHLSGSMRIPTKILLPYSACWRWLLDREDSPWYPSVRLIRQKQLKVWEDPIQKIKQDLESRSPTVGLLNAQPTNHTFSAS